MSEPRDYNQEHQDGSRKYAYDFDSVLRGYMMRTFDPLLPTGRVLELGCFLGDFTELLAARYGHVTVVEAADELVAKASARLGERATFIHGTFEEVSLAGQFEAIFLVHTLEHVDDPVLVLGRIREWLTDEGRLFVVVPNANAASRQIAVHMGLITHNEAVTDPELAHGHRRTYTLDTLERDICFAGLHVTHRGGIFFKPLANYQFDRLAGGDIVTAAYLEGCYRLGMRYPDLCASVYAVCAHQDDE